MPFAYPATEIFNGDNRRVVWSQQEFETALEEGWSEDRPESVDEPPAKTKAKK